MIYITGDTHGKFERFVKNGMFDKRFKPNENDYVIVCGDFGLLWAKDEILELNLNWLSKLPYKILWVQGNHENYNMIAEYPLEEWNGGKVRHIIRDKVILLERGQVFTIEDKTFFTMGGASSHDIQGGVFDRSGVDFYEKVKEASMRGMPYRILNESWWKAELPTNNELEEGLRNLEKCDYNVDYVISHCASNKIVQRLVTDIRCVCFLRLNMKSDILTDYFDKLESKLKYKRWYFGHYHDNLVVDDKHTLLYFSIEPLH